MLLAKRGKKKHEIRELKIYELSLVKNPANLLPFDKISVIKSKGKVSDQALAKLADEVGEFVLDELAYSGVDVEAALRDKRLMKEIERLGLEIVEDEANRLQAKKLKSKALGGFSDSWIFKDDSQHLISTVGYAAEVGDGDDEWVSWDTLKKAVYEFMARKKGSGLRVEHSGGYISQDKIQMVESFLADLPFEKDAVSFPGKSWFVTLHIDDDALWDSIGDTYNGVSWGGMGVLD